MRQATRRGSLILLLERARLSAPGVPASTAYDRSNQKLAILIRHPTDIRPAFRRVWWCKSFLQPACPESTMCTIVHTKYHLLDAKSEHHSTGSMPMVKNPSLSARRPPRRNHLLAALPDADYERLLPPPTATLTVLPARRANTTTRLLPNEARRHANARYFFSSTTEYAHGAIS